MKSALIAIDPMVLKGKAFERLCEMIRRFQDEGLFSRAFVVSVIQPSQFLMPYADFRKDKDELAREAQANVKRACSGKFEFSSVRVLQAVSDTNEEIVDLLSKHSKRFGVDVLVVGSNDRRGLPYWFLGSLSETASLTAKIPVLVLKNSAFQVRLPQKPNFVVAVDVAAPPQAQQISWLVRLAKVTDASVHLIYVEPLVRPVIDRLQQRKNHEEATRILKRMEGAIKSSGVFVHASIREETRSIAHTIVEFAEEKRASLTLVTTPKRSKVRKLLLGSNARHVLALTKRPLLSLRMN
ncbi:MAG: universal stress protein [Bdellovibrionales bacterium]